MPIIEIESAWRKTGIVCPFCEGEWMTYSDGRSRPQCSNPECLSTLPDTFIWEWLITLPEFRPTLRAVDTASPSEGGVVLQKKEAAQSVQFDDPRCPICREYLVEDDRVWECANEACENCR